MKFDKFTTKDVESFANNARKRVKRLVAKLLTNSNASTTSRDNTVLPISLYEGNVADERPIDCDRGHMIALEFGGPEDSENLVPMYGGFNSGGDWRKFESELSSYSDSKKNSASVIEVDITCTYSSDSNDDARIPISFTITAKAENASDAEKTWKIDHPRPKPTITEIDQKQFDLMTSLRMKMNLAGWLIEDHLGKMDDWPSYRTKPVFPKVSNKYASEKERPYGFLDYSNWLAVKDSTEALALWQAAIILSATGDFSSKHTKTILEANRILHGGGLLSDDPDDVAFTSLKYRVIGWPAGTLVEGSRDLAPEVDHIIPQSMTGCATFSNAQVLSGKQNNSKRAKITVLQKMDLSNVDRGTKRVKKKSFLVTSNEDKAREALISVMKKKVPFKNLQSLNLKLETDVVEKAVTDLAKKMTYGLNPKWVTSKAQEVLKDLKLD